MSKLKELIQELCPDGVEYKPLGEISNITRGASPRPIKNFLTNDPNGVNWIKIGDVHPGTKYVTETEERITQKGAEKSRHVKKGDFILSNSMSFGRPYILKIDGCIHDGWLSISDFSKILVSDYLYYILMSTAIQNEMAKKASFGGAVQNLNADIVRSISIPIPPFEVQKEVVSILDSFTEHTTKLTEELTIELTARKQQYEYFRDELLTFDTPVQWLKISDICKKISSGGTPKSGNKEYYGGDIPWLRTQDINWSDIYDTSQKITEAGLEDSSANWISPNCVIVAMYGATAAKVAINKIPLTTNQACCNLEIDENKALYRYVFYWLCKEYHNLKAMGQGSQANINAQIIKRYPIPVPPIAIQRKIVSSLDNFDTFCNSLTDKLSTEKKARQKQYEYYRDKLLSFSV